MTDRFVDRHIGPSPDDEAKMLAVVGYGSLDDLLADAVPATVRTTSTLELPAAAVASSRRLAPATASPVRSSTTVWNVSSASSRPWLISG